jgi:hypothetical protein
MVRPASWLLLVLLAACARSEDSAQVASSNELQQVEQVRSSEEGDGDIALGEWRDSLQGDNAALEFGPSGTPPLFSLRCDARHSVYLQRHGAATGGDLPTMLVSIGSETRRLAVTSGGGPIPMLRASIAPSDTLIRTLGTATAPIIIRIGDAAPLVLPPSPAIGTFLNRCETGEDATAGERDTVAPAPANSVAPAPANSVAPAPPRR